MKRILLLGLLLSTLLFAPESAPAQANTNPPTAGQTATNALPAGTPTAKALQNELALGSDAIYKQSLAALTILFVVAVLLESAFNVIFTSRIFLTFFSSRGLKSIIMIVVGYIIVSAFHIDIFASLVSSYVAPPAKIESNFMSRLITALILAGGSTGVYNLMASLGYRNARRDEQVTPKPPANEAWVAIWVTRAKAVGPVEVFIQSLGPASAYTPQPAPPALAGMAGGRAPRLRELLLRNQDRFPQNGGYTLIPDGVYAITVKGRDKDGNPLTGMNAEKYVFAKGAIIDFEVKL